MTNDKFNKEVDKGTSSRSLIYIWAVIILSVITVGSILLITLFKPGDNSSTITLILGYTVPIVGALLAGALRENHLLMNSRLSQLIEVVESSARAEGIKQEFDRTRLTEKTDLK